MYNGSILLRYIDSHHIELWVDNKCVLSEYRADFLDIREALRPYKGAEVGQVKVEFRLMCHCCRNYYLDSGLIAGKFCPVCGFDCSDDY